MSRMSCPSPLLSTPPSSHPPPQPLPLSFDSYSCTRCPELDLSVTLSPTSKATPVVLKPHPQPAMSHLKSRPRGQRKKNPQPVVITVTPELHLTHPQQPIRSQRSSIVYLHGNHSGASTQWEEPPAPQPSETPVGLARAELHTTLALKMELQSLQGAEFNSQKVIQETLCKSTWTKTLINSKATEGVNVGRSQLLFSSLVSVDVQADQLINQALQDKLLLAPPPRCYIKKPTHSPTLLPCVSDLQREKPIPPEEKGPTRLHPLPFSTYLTFDLYRRQKCWEATP